jgi:hypothetical protein
MIRQAMYPEHYRIVLGDPTLFTKGTRSLGHVNHCIDAIRQSLMCFADTSVVVWQWSNKDERVHPQAGIVHTCRNYEKIVNWAKKNKPREVFDFDVNVEDDIVIPVF